MFHSVGEFHVFGLYKISSFEAKVTGGICSVTNFHNFGLQYLKLNYNFEKKSELKVGNYSDWHVGKLYHMIPHTSELKV